jgi:hypothetical protein
MKKSFWFFVTLLPLFANAQKHDNTWALGWLDNIALHFNDSIPMADSLHSNINYFFTSVNICDTAGHLLFYTNGRMVMNAVGDTMKNGDYLSPQLRELVNWYYDPTSGFQNPQGAIALPKPESDSLY